MGAPGLTLWDMTPPLRISAVDWMRVPDTVTGLVAPIWGAGTISAGIPFLAQSMRFWHVVSLHISGDDGQQSKMARGARAGSPGPQTTASSIRFISRSPSLVKAPV